MTEQVNNPRPSQQQMVEVERDDLKEGDEVWVRGVMEPDIENVTCMLERKNGDGDFRTYRLIGEPQEPSDADREEWKVAVVTELIECAGGKQKAAMDRVNMTQKIIRMLKEFRTELEEA